MDKIKFIVLHMVLSIIFSQSDTFVSGAKAKDSPAQAKVKCEEAVKKNKEGVEAWNDGSVISRFPTSVEEYSTMYIDGTLCLDGSRPRNPEALEEWAKIHVEWIEDTCREDYELPTFDKKKIDKALAAKGVGKRCRSGKCTFRKEYYDPLCGHGRMMLAELVTTIIVTLLGLFVSKSNNCTL